MFLNIEGQQCKNGFDEEFYSIFAFPLSSTDASCNYIKINHLEKKNN